MKETVEVPQAPWVVHDANPYDDGTRVGKMMYGEGSFLCKRCGARHPITFGEEGMPIDVYVRKGQGFRLLHADCKEPNPTMEEEKE